MQSEQQANRIAAVYNAAYMLRHYKGPRRSQAEARRHAIQELGVAVRIALNATEDYLPVLIALIDGAGDLNLYL